MALKYTPMRPGAGYLHNPHRFLDAVAWLLPLHRFRNPNQNPKCNIPVLVVAFVVGIVRLPLQLPTSQSHHQNHKGSQPGRGNKEADPSFPLSASRLFWRLPASQASPPQPQTVASPLLHPPAHLSRRRIRLPLERGAGHSSVLQCTLDPSPSLPWDPVMVVYTGPGVLLFPAKASPKSSTTSIIRRTLFSLARCHETSPMHGRQPCSPEPGAEKLSVRQDGFPHFGRSGPGASAGSLQVGDKAALPRTRAYIAAQATKTRPRTLASCHGRRCLPTRGANKSDS